MLGRDGRALSLYHEAIDAGREHRQTKQEAMAAEAPGRFCLEGDRRVSAEGHLRQARRAYMTLGMRSKAQHLDQEFSLNLGPTPRRTSPTERGPLSQRSGPGNTQTGRSQSVLDRITGSLSTKISSHGTFDSPPGVRKSALEEAGVCPPQKTCAGYVCRSSAGM